MARVATAIQVMGLRRTLIEARLNASLVADSRLLELPTKKVSVVFEVMPVAPDISIPAKARGRLYNDFFIPENMQNIVRRIQDMAEMGFVVEGSRYKNERLEIDFARNKNIFSMSERRPQPDWIRVQHAKLMSRFPFAMQHSQYTASRSERGFSERPSKMILSLRTLDQVEPGRHAFVVLQGENFLRIGPGHPMIGAGEIAQSAGDIEIAKNISTGHNEVVLLSPRSDTYRPSNDSLVHAVIALWRQEIHPRDLKLLEWNNKTLLLDLSM